MQPVTVHQRTSTSFVVATASRQVQFQGIDSAFESQKTERGNRERKTRRERKKAKKMAEREVKENLRYFVMFLQTYQTQRPGRNLRDIIVSVDHGMPTLRLLFIDAADNAACVEAFNNFVTNMELPPAGKMRLRIQSDILNLLMQLFQNQGIYTDLDRFYQELRHLHKQGTLNEYLVALAPNAAEQMRQVLEGLQAWGGFGLTRASDMPQEVRNGLRDFMNAHAAATRPEQNTLVSSSDESSADGDELRIFH